MRKTAVAAILLVLWIAIPSMAEASPPVLYPRATFDQLACPNEQGGGEVGFEGQLSYDLMTVTSVQQHSTGGGVRVGILDSGINPSHSTLAGASLEGGVDLTESGAALSDTYGSGTAFASVLVGSSEERIPVRGIAPGITLVPIKIIDDVPNQITPEYLDQVGARLTAGINWAVENNLDVVVTALSLPSGTDALAAAVERANQAGLMVIAPVGELLSGDVEPKTDEEAARYPAAYDSVLAVTAVDATGSASAYALASTAVDLAAPGQNVPGANNAVATATCLLGRGSPTSNYAAVGVAGVAALLMAAYPQESSATIRHRMEITAIRPESDQPGETGWGIVNPFDALHFIDDGTAYGPLSPDYEKPEVPELDGRDPVVPDPDPQRVTKPITYFGLAVGGALSLALLLGAAGLWKREQR